VGRARAGHGAIAGSPPAAGAWFLAAPVAAPVAEVSEASAGPGPTLS